MTAVRYTNPEACNWQDAWDAAAVPDTAWFPRACGSQPSTELSPMLKEAFMARTLPKRLAGAQAALRSNRDDQDARLLLLQCLPDGPAKDEAIRRAGMKAHAALAAAPTGQAPQHAVRAVLLWLEHERFGTRTLTEQGTQAANSLLHSSAGPIVPDHQMFALKHLLYSE